MQQKDEGEEANGGVDAEATPSPFIPVAEERWLKRLLELNSWISEVEPNIGESMIAGLQSPTTWLNRDTFWKSTPFRQARLAAGLDRYRQGSGSWNQWAEAMLDLRREAEAARTFLEKRPDTEQTATRNAAALTSAWRALAEVDFSELELTHDFRKFVFPHFADFSRSQFGKAGSRSSVSFNDARFHSSIDFSHTKSFGGFRLERAIIEGVLLLNGADIGGELTLNGTRVSKHAWFEGIRVKRSVYLIGVEIKGFASFEGASILGRLGCTRVDFADSASFAGAQVGLDSTFRACTFSGKVDFGRAEISEDESRYQSGRPTSFSGAAIFDQSRFDGPVTFEAATFHDAASFKSIHSTTAFSLASATFAKVPDFTEASFHEPPRLDDTRIATPFPFPLHSGADDPRPSGCMQFFHGFNRATDKDDHARFRKLRKMASEAKDHEKELQFNGYEIASRRFWVDRPGGPGAGRFWWGWLYGLFSNYGQSVLRPAMWWIALLIGAAVYIPTFGGLSITSPACHPTYDVARKFPNVPPLPETSVGFEAAMLSLRNALVFDKNDGGPRAFGCLYGVEVKGVKEDKLEVVVPNTVTVLSLVQRLFSAIFLFLAGLAIRNMYRMK